MMLGCVSVTKSITLFWFLPPVLPNTFDTSYSLGNTSNNNSGGMSNDNTDRGWDDVKKKKKKKKPDKKRTSKQYNPYIEVVDPIKNDANGIATQEQAYAYEPFLVLLVGLPGSGKSTFAQSLVASMPNKFSRINQDELKTRPKCERKLKQVLSVSSSSSAQSRLCPIIDRCNFDAHQRSTWYRLAGEASGQGPLSKSMSMLTTTADANEEVEPGTRSASETGQPSAIPVTAPGIPVDVVVLDIPYEECLRRCQMRKGHETIKSPQQAAGILKQLQRQWSPPQHRKNSEEKCSYRSLTIVRTDKERKDCLLRILKQTC